MDFFMLFSELTFFAATSCTDPPIPPADSNLVLLPHPPEIPFWQTVSYGCEEGHFFDHDRDAFSIEVRCKNDSTWEVPNQWQGCSRPEGKTHINIK